MIVDETVVDETGIDELDINQGAVGTRCLAWTRVMLTAYLSCQLPENCVCAQLIVVLFALCTLSRCEL